MAVEPLTLRPDLDNCLIKQLQEQVSSLRAKLSDVVRDILSLEQEDQSLLEQESALNKVFLDLSLQVRQLPSDG